MGGGHRVGHLRSFGGSFDVTLDIWPDAVSRNARPEERTDDYVQDLAADAAGNLWIGSIPNGLARVRSGPGGRTIEYVPARELVDPKVTALELDPTDGSLWIGHIYGGVTRLRGGTFEHHDFRLFGPTLIERSVPDIQLDTSGGRRRVLVAFERGAIGVYSGR